MSISWFSVVILLIVITVSSIEVYRGIRRGFFPTLLSLGLMIPCSLTALLIAPGLSRNLVSAIMDNFVRPNDYYQALLDDFSSFDILIPAAAQLIVTLLMFVLCFLLLRPVFRFICYCFTLEPLSVSDHDPGYIREKTSFCYRYNTLLGGITGGVCAIIISMVITCPFMGALRVADDVIDMAETFEPELWSMTTLTEEDVEAIKDLPNDLPGNLLYELGGKYAFYAAAKTDINGQTVYLHHELAQIEDIFSHLSAVTTIMSDPTAWTPEEIDQLKQLRDDFNQLQLVHGIAADYFACCAQAWLNGYSYYGFVQPRMHPIAQPLLNDVLQVCATSDYHTVQANATTLLNIYIIILESEALSLPSQNFEEILLFLDRTQLLSKLEAELKSNPNMAHIRISSVGMQIWGDMIQSYSFIPFYLDIFYEDVADALNAVHHRAYGSAEEKAAVLTTYLDKHFKKLEVTVPELLSDALATELAYLEPSETDFTGLDIQTFFNQYT